MESHVEALAQLINKNDEKSYTLVLILVVFLMNLIDKGVAFLLAILLFALVPKNMRTYIGNYGWKQKPLTIQGIREARNISTNKAIHKK